MMFENSFQKFFEFERDVIEEIINGWVDIQNDESAIAIPTITKIHWG